ncbi:MAG: replication restart helicase PriA [Bacteroidaceae bacterium]|jgi:primosomal protein N' (replication factor Y)
MRFAELILPLPLPGCFTYSIPPELEGQLQIGMRVLVPFGKNKYHTGIVRHLTDTPPEGFEIKPIATAIDDSPIVTEAQLRLWEWMAAYYICTAGEVMKAALPAGLRPEGNRKEGLKQHYRPRTEPFIQLNPEFLDEQKLHDALDSLKRADKQRDLFLRFLERCGLLDENAGTFSEKSEDFSEKAQALPAIPRSTVQKWGSPALLTALIKRGLLQCFERETGRLDLESHATVCPNQLNPAQKAAYDSLKAQFREKSTCLLYGVTASGKTELYIHLIEETLRAGKQVLYFLPEIALTTQITERLKSIFGNRLGVYHSQYSDEVRVEIWKKQLSPEAYPLILGARSALFLPFRNLGLIIVDEEHESSYKQFDPAPRYHARDAALKLASYAGARVLLGSATPSIESFHRAKSGQYGFAELKQRYSRVEMPEIKAVDIRELRRKKLMTGNFSSELLAAIRKTLEQGEQILLFQNRRGFAPLVECKACGWVPRCKNCDVSLTYHKATHRLVCHYCGYAEPLPQICPSCGSRELRPQGLGTERVEDEIATYFPQARIARMDADVAHTRRQYEQILSAFSQQKIDILIGTQMISKGLDFGHVRTVGIIDADSMLNFPDFRAHERAFQLMAQVAGRAGRREARGEVLLQTRDAAHPVIAQVLSGNYESLYEAQLQERALFRYPPFYKLIYLFLKHRDSSVCLNASRHISLLLRQYLGSTRVTEPLEPVVARVQQLHIRQTIIKLESGLSARKIREIFQYALAELQTHPEFRSVIVYFDVDPQ